MGEKRLIKKCPLNPVNLASGLAVLLVLFVALSLPVVFAEDVAPEEPVGSHANTKLF